MRSRSHSPAPSGAALVEDRVRDAEPAEAVHQAARRRARTSSSGRPRARARFGGELGDAAGMPEEVRRLQVDEVRDRDQRVVEALAVEQDRKRWLGGDRRRPRR